VKKTLLIAVVIILIGVLIFSFVEISGIFRNNKPVTVNIPKGSGAIKIAEILEENDVIDSEFLFIGYSYLKDTVYHSGNHTFNKKSYSNILEVLSQPEAPQIKRLTIPEGMEFKDIAKLMAENGLGTYDEILDCAKIKNFNYDFLKDIPKREFELEGYLFPDTYEFSVQEGVVSMLNKMLANFDAKFTSEMRIRAKELDMSIDEIVTMASVVEREAAVKNEFDLVAGVFYNRINSVGESRGYLESCATVQYILGERKNVLSVADTKIDSKYNTYMYPGLPQGPIASPGMVAIKAALYPEKTDYLYFVADGSGKHFFAKNFATHQQNMKKAGL
jgi:UPF0755 protein